MKLILGSQEQYSEGGHAQKERMDISELPLENLPLAKRVHTVMSLKLWSVTCFTFLSSMTPELDAL
jgi:hypothetical protein